MEGAETSSVRVSWTQPHWSTPGSWVAAVALATSITHHSALVAYPHRPVFLPFTEPELTLLCSVGGRNDRAAVRGVGESPALCQEVQRSWTGQERGLSGEAGWRQGQSVA